MDARKNGAREGDTRDFVARPVLSHTGELKQRRRESHAAPMSNNTTDSVDLDVSTAPN